MIATKTGMFLQKKANAHPKWYGATKSNLVVMTLQNFGTKKGVHPQNTVKKHKKMSQ